MTLIAIWIAVGAFGAVAAIVSGDQDVRLSDVLGLAFLAIFLAPLLFILGLAMLLEAWERGASDPVIWRRKR